ncbi:MAG TPA: exonuclease domain-containing protein [Gemmatimonadales bacterium]|jgi:DNA polymerase-3 subunit epsilon
MTCSAVPLPLDRCRFAVVDVEATGSAPPAGKLLEVAVAMLDGGAVHLAYDVLLDPGTPVPAAVVRLTGITDQMVAGCPRFADVAPRLGRVLEDAIFVAHNARFDWRWLARECVAAGVPAPQGAPLCTIRLTRRLVPELRHRRLDQVAAFFGVENPARHRAFGDALATAYILRALLGRAAERGVETLEQLRELHDVSRHKLRIANFGLRIGRPPFESAIRNPQSEIPF